METINEFGKLICEMTYTNARIELRIANTIDMKPLYRVIEYIQINTTKWENYVTYYDYSKVAKAEFIKKCEYWIL